MKLSDLTAKTLSENKRLAALLRRTISKSWGGMAPRRKPPQPPAAHQTTSKPELHLQGNPNGNTNRGEDAGSRSAGGTEYPSGIPGKLRHQKFFGIKTPGAPI